MTRLEFCWQRRSLSPLRWTVYRGLGVFESEPITHAVPKTADAPRSSVGVAASVSEWGKVKIGRTGEVFFNKKQMGLADFAVECERLQKAGGALMIFIDTPNGQLSPPQIQAVQKIGLAGLPMKGVQKESDLE